MIRKLIVNTFVACLTLAVVLKSTSAKAVLIDDFSDGNDDGWTHVDLLNITGLGSTNYDASSMEYAISSTNAVFPLPEACNGGGSFWTASFADPQYSNGSVRTKVRFDNDISNALLGIRTDSQGNGYDFALNNASDRIFIDRLTNFVGLPDGLALLDFDLVEGQEYIVEGSAFGPNLSMKVWKVGDPKPANPQLVAVDGTYDSGALWLATYYCAGSDGKQISAHFDDVQFTIPEPSAFKLVHLGLLGLLCLSKRFRMVLV